jgi:predicted nuclease with RNAse H fold
MKSERTVAGIDIGGDRKGNHLVILRGTEIVCNLRKQTPESMLEKCLQFEVAAVAIDAPCLWRLAGLECAELANVASEPRPQSIYQRVGRAQ